MSSIVFLSMNFKANFSNPAPPPLRPLITGKHPTPRDARDYHAMGGGGDARFSVKRAGGAALGAKRRPIEKIERDGDQALDGRGFLFLSNNQPIDGVRNGGGY